MILGAMQEGVLLFDAHQDAAFANVALERHLGARPDSIGHLYPIDLREMVRRVGHHLGPATIEIERSAP